jgi:dienelactone hydrolase
MPTHVAPPRASADGVCVVLAVLLTCTAPAAGAAPVAAKVAAAGAAATAPPALVEETLAVRVFGMAGDGTAFDRRIPVLVVRETAPIPRPFLLLLHGRGADAPARARQSTQSYPANSRYFAHRGFVVLMPLRAGYGASGGRDLEDSGECADKHFDAGIAAGLIETREVLERAAALPYVDGARGLVVGESVGGLIALAAGGAKLAGVVGTVNVAGGDGGDSLNRPDEPCQPDRLRQTLARLGHRGRIPSLWLYSANDRLWGPRYPAEWFAAYRAAGGRGRFVRLPPDKNNGHYIFNRNAAAWQPAFERFAARRGFRP